jgi:hypothetical protein
VSGVTSLRLLRQNLWRHTGSRLPFRIRAASLWHVIFCACILAPRGGPRSEPPRPSGCWPTISFSYKEGVRFHFISFPAFAYFPVLRALRLVQSRRRRSLPEPCSRRTCAVALAAPKIFAAERSTGASSPPLLRAFFGGFHPSPSPASVGAHELAAAPVTFSLSTSTASG